MTIVTIDSRASTHERKGEEHACLRMARFNFENHRHNRHQAMAAYTAAGEEVVRVKGHARAATL
jgi:hypothetical protein